jgi:hypothetical protein
MVMTREKEKQNQFSLSKPLRQAMSTYIPTYLLYIPSITNIC